MDSPTTKRGLLDSPVSSEASSPQYTPRVPNSDLLSFSPLPKSNRSTAAEDGVVVSDNVSVATVEPADAFLSFDGKSKKYINLYGLYRKKRTTIGDHTQREANVTVTIGETSKRKRRLGTYLVYEIHVGTPEENWTVERRYSDFLKLRNEFEEITIYSNDRVPELPPKHKPINYVLPKSFLAERLEKLRGWLDECLDVRMFATSACMVKFLDGEITVSPV
eukprot:Rmarinus@m.22046